MSSAYESCVKEMDAMQRKITRLTAELAEAKESVEIVSRASNAYMVQASRYREALERILGPMGHDYGLTQQIAREVLEG